jgi:hypothetical protein
MILESADGAGLGRRPDCVAGAGPRYREIPSFTLWRRGQQPPDPIRRGFVAISRFCYPYLGGMEAGLRSTPRVGQRVQRASLFEVGLNNDHGILEPSGRQHTRVMSGRARPPKTLESRCTAGETLRYREIAIFELNDRNRNRGFRDTAALSFGRMKVGNSGSAEASMTPEPNLAPHTGRRRPAPCSQPSIPPPAISRSSPREQTRVGW